MIYPIFIYNTPYVETHPGALQYIKNTLEFHEPKGEHKYRRVFHLLDPVTKNFITRKNLAWLLVTTYHSSESDTQYHWTLRLIDPTRTTVASAHIYLDGTWQIWATGYTQYDRALIVPFS